jgi:hypothetical protein
LIPLDLAEFKLISFLQRSSGKPKIAGRRQPHFLDQSDIIMPAAATRFVVVFALLLALLVGGCKRNKAGPVWQPGTALLDQLDTAKDLDVYQMRVPKGYEFLPQPGNAPAGVKAFGWAGARRADGTAPSLTAMLAVLPAGEKKASLDEYMRKLLDGVKRRRTGWVETAVEKGQINGLTFLRARWSGTDTSTNMPMHGFMYAAMDKETYIGLSSQDIDPNHDQPLKLAEAAVLTFKKK